MNLKNFIVNTILDIDNAIKEIAERNKITYIISDGQKSYQVSSDQGTIDFDLAVGSEEGDKSKGEGGFNISVLSIGVGKESIQQTSQYSRIKFSLRCSNKITE